MEQCSDRNGTRVDHRVIRPVCPTLELDRVECIATRFDTNVLKNLFVPELFDGHTEGERLGHRLDRERPVVVACLEDPAIGCHKADTEVVGVGLPQLRDIRGHLALGERSVLAVQIFDQALKFVLLHTGPCHVALPANF